MTTHYPGAMENWGLITYRETCLLVDEENTSAANRQWVALVVGHEIAHQWFGKKFNLYLCCVVKYFYFYFVITLTILLLCIRKSRNYGLVDAFMVI